MCLNLTRTMQNRLNLTREVKPYAVGFQKSCSFYPCIKSRKESDLKKAKCLHIVSVVTYAEILCDLRE